MHAKSKALVNHKPATEFVLLHMAAVVDVAVFLNFAPLPYPPHFLNGGDVSPTFYEGFRQLGKDTIPIEVPNVPAAYP